MTQSVIEGEFRNTATPQDMEAAGEAFGEFQNMLAAFPSAWSDHNLARARNQLTLVRRMEAAYDKIKQITEEIHNENSGH